MRYVRSRADASILAVVFGNDSGVKLTTAAVPYDGEHGVGSNFRYTEQCWEDHTPDADERLAILHNFERAACPTSMYRG